MVILIKAQSCLDIYGAGATVCDGADEKLEIFSEKGKFDFLR